MVAQCPSFQQVKAEHQRPGGLTQYIELPLEMGHDKYALHHWFASHSTEMSPYKAVHGWKCRSLIGWFEVGEAELLGPNLVQQAIEKVKLIRDCLRTAQSWQKSYADVQR
uniref:Uncharacterized protein n=1 Tax=Nicotiana tabacum TaxID=4097 RepID=A0A1S4DFB6_TOBAC|nr:PREDICTED: uncharacterized protein LOC107829105 [Nicotiana tabacum]